MDLEWLHRWTENGIKDFRLEFVHQSPEVVKETISAFQAFFKGSLSSDDLKKKLNQSGQATTEGSLFVPENFKDLVQLR